MQNKTIETLLKSLLQNLAIDSHEKRGISETLWEMEKKETNHEKRRLLDKLCEMEEMLVSILTHSHTMTPFDGSGKEAF